MDIIDINGRPFEIENLQLAIMQADDNRHYRHLDPRFDEVDKKMQAYWEDIYQKLLQYNHEI